MLKSCTIELLNSRASRRRWHPSLLEHLEGRFLLSESASWVGQNNADLVGRDGTSPDGYQDIQVHLSGLDTQRAIQSIYVQRYSGGAWLASGRPSDNAVVGRSFDEATGTWSADAELDLEPYFDDPSNFLYELVRITYADSSTAVITDLRSTTPVDPSLRVRGRELDVAWLGQDGLDLAGSGLAVGPDGIKDIHLRLSNLLDYRRAADGSTVILNPNTDSVVITMPTAEGTTATWLAGPRPASLTGAYNRAELIPDPSDPSRADLYLDPVVGLVAGGEVSVSVTYARIGKGDVSPNAADPYAPPPALIATAPDVDLAADPPPTPFFPVSFDGPSASWAGQDGAAATLPGLAHVTVTGLPIGWSIVDATLSDNVASSWTLRDADPARVLTIRPLDDPTQADLSFPPARDESDALMTLRFRLAGGSVQYVTQFRGGFADPALRDPGPRASSITVDPAFVSQRGHDLNTLVQLYGSVHLLAGDYPLSAPLDLVDPVTLTADPGAVLSFSQASGDPAWSYAIEIHASHTTLDGPTIRFATPIRWAADFQLNPAVIGSTYGPVNYGLAPKVDISLRNLDIAYAPTAADLDGDHLTTVRLIRMNYEDSGTISGNTLLGGDVEVWGGPWRIISNDLRGASAGTSLASVLTVHGGHDVLIAGNHAHQVSPSGTTYRFAVFDDRASGLTVRDNVIDGGIGRDASIVPAGAFNMPEIIVTESYYPHYEGMAMVGAASRRLLQVPSLRGDPGVAGDLVAILSGPHAGRWFRIAQAIDANNYVLDGELPEGDFAVSITRGYINEVYEDNTIDTSSLGESSSVAFNLVGPHAGTEVRDNLVIGAKPFFISASPTQESLPASTPTPAPWGWSHLPILDLLIEGNTFQDPVFWVSGGDGSGASRTIAAGTLTVEHETSIQENSGRLYLTAALIDNRFVYSDGLLEGTSGDVTAVQVGSPGSVDTAELNLTRVAGNVARTPASFAALGRSVVIHFTAGTVAGQPAGASEPLPAPPTVIPGVTGRSLGQDGSDETGRSATPGADGDQDVHIVLGGLPTHLAIRTVDVNPYGYGHYQYAAPGLPADTPGLTPAAWRAAVTRAATGPVTFAATADLFVQPDRIEDGRNHWDVLVTFADSSTAFVSVWGIVVSDPSLPVGASAAGISAVSLGQDGADLVGKSATAGPDGFQDVHIALSGLPAGVAVAQVDVFPYGYGHYQFVAPSAPPLPNPHPGIADRNPAEWRAVLVRKDDASTTADLYVPSIHLESGLQAGTSPPISNHYDVMILFADGSTAMTVVWGVVDDPTLRVERDVDSDGTARTLVTEVPDAMSAAPSPRATMVSASRDRVLPIPAGPLPLSRRTRIAWLARGVPQRCGAAGDIDFR